MDGMDRWDWVLLLGTTYVAVMVLVRLMRRRRDKVVAHLRAHIRQERPSGQTAGADSAGQQGDEAA